MKKLLMILMLFTLASCKIVKVGEFTPERHQLHDLNRPDCEQTPDKCIDGVPW